MNPLAVAVGVGAAVATHSVLFGCVVFLVLTILWKEEAR